MRPRASDGSISQGAKLISADTPVAVLAWRPITGTGTRQFR